MSADVELDIEFVSAALEIGTCLLYFCVVIGGRAAGFMNTVTVLPLVIENDDWVRYAVALTGLDDRTKQ
jgi:hypothetical protein